MTDDDGFEIKFLPGVSPREGGCPPLNSRIEHADGMVIEYDATVTMRDGIEIYADVFRPVDAEAVPVIVAWGPYGKHGPVKYDLFPNHGIAPEWVSGYAGFEAPDPLYWTHHGYAVINVDPRGMWNSQGDATFYSAQEARDVYDLIEWAGTQPWSTGKVGMSGVSYLAITQWRAAADHPPHLAAINPWEGLSDRYREMSYHGGIPEDRFGPMWRSRRVPYSTGRVEDTVAMYAEHPLCDEYWKSKTPDLARVQVPAFVVASWSDQGLHTRGTIEGFRRIASEDKWLLVMAGRNGSSTTSRRTSRCCGSSSITSCAAWPRAWVRGRACAWRCGSASMSATTATTKSGRSRAPSIGLCTSTRLLGSCGRVPATPRPRSDTTPQAPDGPNSATDSPPRRIWSARCRLHLWVHADGADDMDLFVAVQKLDDREQIVPFSFFNSLEDGPVALGWLRASHRELDEVRSSPAQPWHPHRREHLLAPEEVVAVDIEIWPSGTRFGAGETLRLIIQGRDVYTYPPGVVNVGHSQTRNAGSHVIHTGGRYDSHLLIPVIPA